VVSLVFGLVRDERVGRRWREAEEAEEQGIREEVMAKGGRGEKRTQNKLLRRRQHIQRERDLILISFPLQPAQEGGRDGGVLGRVEDGEDEEEEGKSQDQGEDGGCVHGWCGVVLSCGGWSRCVAGRSMRLDGGL